VGPGPTHTARPRVPKSSAAGACPQSGEYALNLHHSGQTQKGTARHGRKHHAHATAFSSPRPRFARSRAPRTFKRIFKMRSEKICQRIAEHEAQEPTAYPAKLRANRSRTLNTAIADHLAPDGVAMPRLSSSPAAARVRPGGPGHPTGDLTVPWGRWLRGLLRVGGACRLLHNECES